MMVVQAWVVDQVDYVILYVRDLAASIASYRDVLGLPFRFEDRGLRGVRHAPEARPLTSSPGSRS
ncbi:MAG: VOC family protein [Actinomycetota bacterium]